jgi:hypothetical protein
MQAVGLGVAVVIGTASRCGRGRSGSAGGSGSAVGSPLAACGLVGGRLCEELVEAAGEVALEGAERAFGGLAFGFFARQVGLRRRVALGSGGCDDVQRVVELAVPATVEPVLGALARGTGDRGESPLFKSQYVPFVMATSTGTRSGLRGARCKRSVVTLIVPSHTRRTRSRVKLRLLILCGQPPNTPFL